VVDGPLLALPSGTTIVDRTVSNIVLGPTLLDAQQEDGGPDLLVGLLPLVHWSESTGGPDVAYLDVPPPMPFAPKNAQHMWNEIRSSGTPVPTSVLAQGRVTAGRTEKLNPQQLELENVREALAASLRILRRWPRSEDIRFEWRPIDVRAGREDVLYTERHGRSGLSGRWRDDGPVLLDRTARRRPDAPQWQSGQLASLASALAASMEALAHTTQLDGIAVDYSLRILRELASVARPAALRPDPPISSWPPAARAVYRSLLRAFVQLGNTRADDSRAPLSHFWQLYEAWVGVRVLGILETLLGARAALTTARPGASQLWEARWKLGDGSRVVLLAQPLFSGSNRRVDAESANTCVSLTSDLIPDVLLAATAPASQTARVTVFDAKKRGVTTAMSRADVAEASSKYLWGIRWDAGAQTTDKSVGVDPQVGFAVREVVILTSSTAPKMHSSKGKIRAIELRPNMSDDTLRLVLSEVLAAATVSPD
jgi:hypothetical protein